MCYYNWCAPMRNARVFPVRHVCVGLLVLVLGGWHGSRAEGAVQSCPSPVPAPILQPGDTWQWEDEKGGNWTRRYVGQTDEGLFERQDRPRGARFFYDHEHTLRKVYRDGIWITEANLDFPLIGKPVLVFPLQVGKSWSSQTFAREATGGSTWTYNQTFTVLGCEQVTVPAGTFSAVVIEEEQRIFGGRPGDGVRTWWYAPEVKYFVKLAHGRASHPGYWSAFRDWTLTSYRLASGPVSQPQAAPAAPPVSSTPPSPAPPGPRDTPIAETGKVGTAPVMAPTWERGYEWKFRWSSPRGSGAFVWSVVGEEIVGGVAHYILKTGTRDLYYTKDELAWLMDRVEGTVEAQASPAYRKFAWPLEVGREWEAIYRWENPADRSTEDRIRRHKVESLEFITVPAGTFQTFHVMVKSRAERLTDEYWYSPEVKWIVKDKTYFSYGVRERELLEYKLKPTVAPLSSPGSGR